MNGVYVLYMKRSAEDLWDISRCRTEKSDGER